MSITKLYMYTDGEGWSRDSRGERRDPRWGPGFSHSRKNGFPAYTDPRLADLIDPAFSYFPWGPRYSIPSLAGQIEPAYWENESPYLWEAETEDELHMDSLGIRAYVRELQTIKVIPNSSIPVIQHVRFAIRCVTEVCTDNAWQTWANTWLDGDYTTASRLGHQMKMQMEMGRAFIQPEVKSVIEAARCYNDLRNAPETERRMIEGRKEAYRYSEPALLENAVQREKIRASTLTAYDAINTVKLSAQATVQAAESAKYLGRKIDFISIASKLDS